MLNFLITFRETLEAALVIGIVCGYLIKTGSRRYLRHVFWGALSGLAASAAGAVLFRLFAGGFTGRAEAIFEGVVMIIGSALLSVMIIWMMRQKNTGAYVKKSTVSAFTTAQGRGIFFLIFFAVLREGIETIVFLTASSAMGGSAGLVLPLAGIAAAAAAGYFFYKGSALFDLRKFFAFTTILLVFFAAGLAAYGVHELQEAGLIPVLAEHIWDINPATTESGALPVMHENGAVGSILKGLFGYNGNPNFLEVMTYILYLACMTLYWKKYSRGSAPAAS